MHHDLQHRSRLNIPGKNWNARLELPPAHPQRATSVKFCLLTARSKVLLLTDGWKTWPTWRVGPARRHRRVQRARRPTCLLRSSSSPPQQQPSSPTQHSPRRRSPHFLSAVAGLVGLNSPAGGGTTLVNLDGRPVAGRRALPHSASHYPRGQLWHLLCDGGANYRGRSNSRPRGRRIALLHSDGHYPRCLLYTSPSPRDGLLSRMPSSA